MAHLSRVKYAKEVLPAEVSIEVSLDEALSEAAIDSKLAKRLGISLEQAGPYHVLKRSLDARRTSVRYRFLFAAGPAPELTPAPPREVRLPARVVVVGAGPAGLFCAYQLARHGVGSVVLDRGKAVQPRRRDLKGLNRKGQVDPDSNYCFGEGGAGTFSDGKLYTRAHKRGSVRDVLELFVAHGADPSILTEARPHIGSNRLPQVVSALRQKLEGVGVSFRFGEKVTALLTASNPRRVQGVRLSSGEEIEAAAVVFAVGHSARDAWDVLARAGVKLEDKPFAVGVRVEHPQALINRIQYGSAAGHPALPSASYRLVAQVDGRGVFSFCMCPGGFIVPAATTQDELVVNGMSLSKRDSAYANSGLVVGIGPAELSRYRQRMHLSPEASAGVELQRSLERAAAQSGGGKLRAPATRVTDFIEQRPSAGVPEASYQPGLSAANLAEVLDVAELGLSDSLQKALLCFERSMKGYLTEQAVLVGVETRTSSPIRVPRDPESLQSPSLSGLYPSGEGAGYAGGIMSAALDGMRVADAVASHQSLSSAAPLGQILGR